MHEILKSLAVDPMFYESSVVSKVRYYSLEQSPTFFMASLASKKVQYRILCDADVINSSEVLKRVNLMLLFLLNKTVDVSQQKFRMIHSYVQKINIQKKAGEYITLCSSGHVVHRPSKIYGVYIRVETAHNHVSGMISITSVIIDGFIFEDRLDLAKVLPSSLEASSEGTPGDHQVLVKSDIENKKEVAAYFDRLAKIRGIS